MTGSEKGHTSMTSGEHQPPEGRHRHHQGTWTPEVTHTHPPAHARPEPAVPEPTGAVPTGAEPTSTEPTGSEPADPEPVPPPSAAETTVPGLQRFDLGTIPASVTPPRTWRRAALFAVGASLAVVCGLIFAAAALVGRPKSNDTIDALPGMPSAPAFLDAQVEPSKRATPKATTSRAPERGTSSAATPTQSYRGPVATPTSGPGTTSSSARVSASAPSAPSTQPAPPVRETTPKRAFATNDPKQIGDRTEAFYKQVTDNPSAAYQMTTGELRGQGEQAFRQRYADIKAVEVRRIGIDPNQGTTVSEVKITKADGSTFTERRRLKFTSGQDPKISSELTH